MRYKVSANDDCGASLVEFALILPVLMGLILGMFTGGIAYNRKITMTDAVREGARFGATLSDPATPPGTGSCATADSWCDQVRQRVVALSAGELQLNDVCAVLAYQPDTSPATPAGCSAAVTGKPANPAGVPTGMPTKPQVVKVWALRTANLETIVTKRTLVLTSRIAARYERQE